MRPSPAQKKILKKLPQRRTEIERAIDKNGRLRKTYIAIQKHGWAKYNERLGELQRTVEGSLVS